MKNRTKLKMVLCLLTLFLLCFASGCSDKDQNEEPAVESVDITLSIDYPKSSNRTDIREVPFKLEENTTVLQLIEVYGNVNNLPVLVDTTHATLEGINGVQNGILWKNGTWKFKINGKYTSKAENEQVLAHEDFVEFIYVKK